MQNIFIEEEPMTFEKVLEILDKTVRFGASDLYIQYRANKGTFELRKEGILELLDEMSHQKTYDFCKILFEALTTDARSFDPSQHIPAAHIVVLGKQKIKLRYQIFPLLPSYFDVIVRFFPIDSKDKITP